MRMTPEQAISTIEEWFIANRATEMLPVIQCIRDQQQQLADLSKPVYDDEVKSVLVELRSTKGVTYHRATKRLAQLDEFIQLSNVSPANGTS